MTIRRIIPNVWSVLLTQGPHKPNHLKLNTSKNELDKELTHFITPREGVGTLHRAPSPPLGSSGRTGEERLAGAGGPRPVAPGGRGGRGSPKVRSRSGLMCRSGTPSALQRDPGPISNSACGPGCPRPWPWGWAPACLCPAGPAARCARSPAGSSHAPPAAAPAPAPPPM